MKIINGKMFVGEHQQDPDILRFLASALLIQAAQGGKHSPAFRQARHARCGWSTGQGGAEKYKVHSLTAVFSSEWTFQFRGSNAAVMLLFHSSSFTVCCCYCGMRRRCEHSSHLHSSGPTVNPIYCVHLTYLWPI